MLIGNVNENDNENVNDNVCGGGGFAPPPHTTHGTIETNVKESGL